MKPAAISFRKITIRRMPGFRDGGFEVDGLCPGVNVVYGPNASGKTTLGRAIRKLVWPSHKDEIDPSQVSLLAQFAYGESDWHVDCEAGIARYQQDGQGAEAPTIASAETADRYTLALVDLIEAEDNDLAKTITRESAGGYDVDRAADDLKFSDTPKFPQSLKNTWKAADEAVREATSRQEDLHREQSGLAALIEKRDSARAAGGRAQAIKRAIAYQEALAAFERSRTRLEQFSPAMARLTGQEGERLAELDGKIEEERDRVQAAQSRRDDAERQRAECGLPDDVPRHEIAALRTNCSLLQKESAEIRAAQVKLREAVEAQETAEMQLGGRVADEQLQAWNPALVEQLFDLAKRLEGPRIALQEIDKLQRLVGDAAAPNGSDDLRRRIDLLREWLASGDAGGPTPKQRKIAMAAAAGAAFGALLLALLVHLSWIAAVIILTVLAVAVGLSRPATMQRSAVEGRWKRHGFDGPAGWHEDAVRDDLRSLEEQLAVAEVRHEESVRWGDLGRRREEVAKHLEELQQEAKRFADEFGLGPELSDGPEPLYVRAQNLADWQKLVRRRMEAEATLRAADGNHRQLLADINASLAEFGCSPGSDHAAVEAVINELDARSNAYRDALAAMETANREVANGRARVESHAAERARHFESVGLAPNDEATLRAWLADRQRYLDAKRESDRAEDALDAAAAALAGHESLGERSRESLDADLEEAQREAGELQSLSETIGGIQKAVAKAKSEADVETRLAARDEAADKLREDRQRSYASAVGQVLADHLRQVSRDRDRPAVFRRARQEFVGFTHGRYRLDLGEGDPPAFRAIDTSTNVGHALDELSSGTRLQLLLAVRVAFVETQELGPKLPLVLDETLGNSDERRARKIIDAALDICRQGRQVFYFTAQHDEVGKWQSILKDRGDVPFKLVDLAAVRDFSDLEKVPPLPIEAPPRIEIPSPDGHDYLSYGRRLGVPAFDPQSDVAGAHLWHVVDDVRVLHKLLLRGINRWGQFANLMRHGKTSQLVEFQGTFHAAEASAKVIAAYSKAWRIGRGKRVDAEVLKASDQVSDVFLERLADLARSVDGDARRIVEALEGNEVKRFQADKREALKQYLVDEGYLPTCEPLTFEELHPRVLAETNYLIDDGRMSLDRFHQLMAVLGGGDNQAGAESPAGNKNQTGARENQDDGGAPLRRPQPQESSS